jgi:hypothetical protein
MSGRGIGPEGYGGPRRVRVHRVDRQLDAEEDAAAAAAAAPEGAMTPAEAVREDPELMELMRRIDSMEAASRRGSRGVAPRRTDVRRATRQARDENDASLMERMISREVSASKAKRLKQEDRKLYATPPSDKAFNFASMFNLSLFRKYGPYRIEKLKEYISVVTNLCLQGPIQLFYWGTMGGKCLYNPSAPYKFYLLQDAFSSCWMSEEDIRFFVQLNIFLDFIPYVAKQYRAELTTVEENSLKEMIVEFINCFDFEEIWRKCMQAISRRQVPIEDLTIRDYNQQLFQAYGSKYLLQILARYFNQNEYSPTTYMVMAIEMHHSNFDAIQPARQAGIRTHANVNPLDKMGLARVTAPLPPLETFSDDDEDDV